MLSFMLRAVLVVLLMVALAGCAAVAGIFKAGFWTGLIIAVIVIVLLLAVFGRRG
jgi:hypothetical protein